MKALGEGALHIESGTPPRAAYCARCGNPFVPNQGRGRRSAYCSVCRQQRAKEHSLVRQFSTASAGMVEVSLLYGGELTRRRQRLQDSQEGRCAACQHKRRRLFVVERTDGIDAGLCFQCFMKEVNGAGER